MQTLVRVVWCALIAVSLWAQECRLTPLTPAQPPLKIEEGERATESETFQTNVFALSPADVPHFFDTASRIRRIDADGRMVTVAGNGTRSQTVTPGDALANGLPAVSQIVFSPDGVLHFTSVGRVFRLVNGSIEAVAGSGRPGFNGESLPAAEISLGNIVWIAFDGAGRLYILDGYTRVRTLDDDGTVRTIVGSTRPAATAGFTGDNGPGTSASLLSPRQIVPLPDGSMWIKDVSGRHLRVLTPEGIIRTINQNFEASVVIMMFPDGRPAAATSNRVYPIRPNGAIETGGNPFPPFTGTPRGIGSDGALFYQGSTRPEQRNPLVRMYNRVPTVIAAAPVAATVDGQAPPYGVWNPRTNTLFYSASVGGKTGVLEARPGQTPRFVLGGGNDIGEPEGKTATDLSIFGIVAFSIDGEGRIVVADANRRRILVVGTDGKVSLLKNAAGEPVIYAPLGSFSSMQRIAADSAGNIYWYQRGGTPAGGVFTADIAVWSRRNSEVVTFEVVGLSALSRLEDGSIAVLAGNSASYRTAYHAGPLGRGAAMAGFQMLPLTSVTRFGSEFYFAAATRLFRGRSGSIQMLDLPNLPGGGTFNSDFVLSSPTHLIVHLGDGGFYRIEDTEGCDWISQPAIATNGVVNAASYEFADTVSPRGLITIFGTGLGPAGGQGMVLDGVLRAGGQPAPYPAMTMGNFNALGTTLSGTALPVIYSDDTRITVQTLNAIPASGEYRLYFTWQGLTLIYPLMIRAVAATPGFFAENGVAVALNKNGSRHSTANPAARGSLITLLGTGFGAVTGTLANGEFFGANPLPHNNAVEVTIGGEPAQVEFAGGFSGAIGGTSQLRIRVPEGLAPGAHPVAVHMDAAPLQSNQNVVVHIK